MENPKLLITAGCSYSQVPPNYHWPKQLENILGCKGLHLGQGAAGNAYISRKLLHHLNKQLQVYKGKDLLVGVMWSGYARQNFYLDKKPLDYTDIFYGEPNHNYMNPAALEAYQTKRNNYFANIGWTDELTSTYFKIFYDELGAILNTLEHILRIQLICEKYNIRYFFTNYNIDTVPISFDELMFKFPESYKEAEHLYQQIDWDKWLPVRHAWKWMIEESGYPEDESLGNHGTDEQNKAFTERVIVPYIKKLGYID